MLSVFVNYAQADNDDSKLVSTDEVGDSEMGSVEPPAVTFEDLMARIRHIVLTNRLRV